MKRMLFNATYQEELRVATVQGQKLIDFDIETTSKTQCKGNIYKGVITRVETSLEACFVDYGTEKQGFLPFKEIDNAYLPETARHRDFSKLNEGDELIVQVEKDERGNKGAALTTYISLPGRYLVLMPNNSRAGGISRRIDGDERDELKSVLSALEIPEKMSIIARTAALGRFPEELQWDLNYLVKLWSAITTATATQVGSFLIYQESNLVVRSIRDHFSPDITEILIDMEDIYEQARQFMFHVMPNFVSRVKLYRDDVPLFSRFQIEHQIETAYGRVVHLPSGGSIAIDHTEALTAVDVNSAKANKGSDIEATAFSANMEAAEEISRQLRLRDLGGLVVVDFIDMENTKNQREVENFFKQQLGLDRARIQMGKLSKFGLLELSRQRLQASLDETTTIPCPRCAGVGSIRGTESTAVHILRIIEEEVVKKTNTISALHVQVPVEIATYLLNEKRDDVAKIELRMKVKIVLIPNIYLDSPHYKIRKINSDSSEEIFNKLSYTLVENPEENAIYSVNDKKSDTSLQNKAVVKNITSSKSAPVMRKGLLGNIMRKINKLFQVESLAKLETKPATVVRKIRSTTVENKKTETKTTKNKLRPVGINLSNTKVQTVRPSNTTGKAGVSKQKVNTDVDTVESISPQRKQPVPKLVKVSKPAGLHDNIVEKNALLKQQRIAQAEKSTADVVVKEDSIMVKPTVVINEDKVINQAWKPSPLVEEKRQPQITTQATQPIILDKTEDISVATVSEIKTPVVRINTITKAVDLGKLEMVATDLKLTIPMVEINQAPVKRYKDIVAIKSDVKVAEVSYELVETKI